jgi:CRP/FNR family transcriptional regulator
MGVVFVNMVEKAFHDSEYFKEFDEEMIQQISNISSVRVYDKGAYIFSEGEFGSKVFLTFNGKIKIFKMNSSGKEFVIKILQGGDFFAESLLFDYHPKYPSTAQVIEKSDVIEINKSAFEHLLEMNCAIAVQIIKNMSKRLLYLSKRFENLTIGSSITKVSFFIYDLAQSRGIKKNGDILIEIEDKREIMANMLNLSRENFERTLTYLQNEDLIHVSRKNIIVKSIDKLKELAFNI